QADQLAGEECTQPAVPEPVQRESSGQRAEPGDRRVPGRRPVSRRLHLAAHLEERVEDVGRGAERGDAVSFLDAPPDTEVVRVCRIEGVEEVPVVAGEAAAWSQHAKGL